MGWASMPRQISNPFDKELMQAVRTLLQGIINSGDLPDIFNRTRLIMINKSSRQVPRLSALRLIQVADIMRVYLESLAQPELKRLANSPAVTGEEQYGFKNGKGTSQCILRVLDLWSNLWRRATKKQSGEVNHYLLFVDWKSAFDNVDHDILMKTLARLGTTDRTMRIVHIFLFSSNFSTDGKNCF
jgi:hypothetical protein